MLGRELHKKIHFWLCLCIAFFLPIARLVPVFISLLLINWIFEGDFASKFKKILKQRFALLFILFYLIHLLGLIYTNNISSGLFDVQVKLSLFLFPLLLASKPIESKNKPYIFLSLLCGCLATVLFLLIRATWIYFSVGQNDFFYEPLSSYLLHPSYLAMYITVVIMWLLLNIINPKKKELQFSVLWSSVFIIVFTVFVILLSSKTGIGILLLLFVGTLVWVIWKKEMYAVGFGGLLIISISFVMVMKFVPSVSARIDIALAALKNTTPNPDDVESTAVRMLVWQASQHVISQNLLLGVGTGDTKDVLMQEYKDDGMSGAYSHELNAHNEYFQITIALGIIGFVVLLAMLWFPVFGAIKSGNTVYLLFLLIIILNFLTESMFETQAGVMFYAFFNSLLCFQKQKQ